MEQKIKNIPRHSIFRVKNRCFYGENPNNFDIEDYHPTRFTLTKKEYNTIHVCNTINFYYQNFHTAASKKLKITVL